MARLDLSQNWSQNGHKINLVSPFCGLTLLNGFFCYLNLGIPKSNFCD